MLLSGKMPIIRCNIKAKRLFLHLNFVELRGLEPLT
jgi:hypothetical protein